MSQEKLYTVTFSTPNNKNFKGETMLFFLEKEKDGTVIMNSAPLSWWDFFKGHERLLLTKKEILESHPWAWRHMREWK